MLFDGSSFNNDASLIGSPVWTAGRVGDYSIRFNGTTQYASVPDNASLDITNQITIAAWIKPENLEFVEGSNKAVVYSSKNGHASFSKSGMYLQGSALLGIGIRNDSAKSDLFVDSSLKYEIVAAEYLRGAVVEPPWLGYMREWGPKIVYNSRSEIEKLNERLPWRLRSWVDAVLRKIPVELSGEEGPTGPKEKNNWFGDERW